MQGKRLSNCLIAALLAWARSPRGSVRLVVRRNRCGRWHVLWRDGERLFEFYGRGASQRTYLQNLLYRGEVREVKA